MNNDRGSAERLPVLAGVRALALSALLLGGMGNAIAAEPCDPTLAKVVSVQGDVHLIRANGSSPAELNAGLCAGDQLRVPPRGRAAVALNNQTVVRLDQGTTLTLGPPSGDNVSPLGVCSGALYVITRTPRQFKINTPFVNANVKGTEFLVEVERAAVPSDCNPESLESTRIAAGPDAARITVYEGQVDVGPGVQAGSGETVQASAGSGPVKALVARPRDAVAWTLYFPAIFDHRSEPTATAGAGEAERERERSIAQYRNGNLGGALATVESLPAAIRDPRLLTYRASLFLLVGRLTEARSDIAAALAIDARNGDAYALLAVISIVGNDKEQARRHADTAVRIDPRSSAALMAQSYVQQATFDIEQALASVRLVLVEDDRNALAWARLAELEMSTGNLDGSLNAARRAVDRDPTVARTHMVLGFANLTRIDTDAAKLSFAEAIRLDQTDPLPRLGLGLAKIRDGDLAGGRQDIEVAAVLDPQSSLVRSYLGKAYYEESRSDLATEQFHLAVERDAQDPTPYLYAAVLQQAENRPIQALRDFDKSIALNDNRAVYRSRLLLDQDLAARSVRLAYAYRELGFDQLASLEALKSLSLDPTDSAAHRLLADSYLGRIRTEAARVSELLQAQLRQPLGLNSLQPQLLRDQHLVVEGAGPAQSGAYEFSPLFTRNQVAVKLDAMAGSNKTVGDQIFVSGLRDSVAYSVGQYRYESDGLRPNNDLRRDIYSAFLQISLSPSVRFQAEIRDDVNEQGDLSSRFDPSNFSPTLRDELRQRTLRLGGLVAFDSGADLLVSAVAGTSKALHGFTDDPTATTEDREHLQALEFQHAVRRPQFHVLTGLSYYKNKTVIESGGLEQNLDSRETAAYALLTRTDLPWGLKPQIGISYDTYERPGRSLSQFNPRLGLMWSLADGTTLRAAAFRVIKRNFAANQTLQPAQLSGFSLFSDDPNGTISRRVGIGFDHKVSDSTFIGLEWSHREMDVPGFPGDPDSRWTERLDRVYAYRILTAKTSATVEYQLERFRRPEENTGNEGFTRLRTVLFPLGLRYNAFDRWSIGIKATHVRQSLRYEDINFDLVDGDSSFVVADMTLSYRLPRRGGMASLEVRNIFDKRFQYQEIDFFSSPRVAARRLLFFRLSLAF